MQPDARPLSKQFHKTFGWDDSDWFTALSGDLNPLHRDAHFATLTPWGKPVLHGMAAVFAALQVWRHDFPGQKGPVALQSLRVQFSKAIFSGQELELRVSGDDDGKAILEWVRGESVYVRIEVRLSGSTGTTFSVLPSALFPRAVARSAAEPMRWNTDSQLPDFKYSIDGRMLQNSRSSLGATSFAVRQLQVLAWASYFVGMEWPGASALFVDASFEFSEFSRSASAIPLSLDSLRSTFDSRFRVWTLKGSSKDAGFQLRAVERPAPVTYSTELLTRCLPETSVFHDKNILITGGSRGFGSLLCDGLNRLGARVWYTSRSASKDRHNIAADMSDAMSCLHMSERLLAADLNLDGVILNASPPITMNDWLEQRDIDTLSFISTTSAMALFPLRALLPRLKSKGFVIYISSEYVKKPIRHFSHYVAAKSAAEGLIRALSIEFPHQSFTIVRPPKMLTNQTNVAFDYNPPAKTEMVVGQFLSQLAKPEAIAPGLTEIDLKLPHGVS